MGIERVGEPDRQGDEGDEVVVVAPLEVEERGGLDHPLHCSHQIVLSEPRAGVLGGRARPELTSVEWEFGAFRHGGRLRQADVGAGETPTRAQIEERGHIGADDRLARW